MVVADDHGVVRDGLRLIIEAQPDISVVGEASSVRTTAAAVAEQRPDVLLLDLNLGAESGLRALPALRAASPETAVVILTMQKDPAYARQALERGAVGYVLKDAAAHELVRAIRTAAAGGTYLEPELGAALVRPAATKPSDDALSRREREILALIGLGHTSAEIAQKLSISVRTVESHRARINEKLGVSGRAELIRRAREHGLVDL